jgi:hypothetical protein
MSKDFSDIVRILYCWGVTFLLRFLHRSFNILTSDGVIRVIWQLATEICYLEYGHLTGDQKPAQHSRCGA